MYAFCVLKCLSLLNIENLLNIERVKFVCGCLVGKDLEAVLVLVLWRLLT